MIGHDRARSLAATAIDFPLDAPTSGELEHHLRECVACRTAAADYAVDAHRLAVLPPIPPTALGLGRTRTAGSARLGLLVAVSLLVALALAAMAVGGAVIERTRHDGEPSLSGVGLGWRPVDDPDLVFDAAWSFMGGVIPGGPGAIAWGSEVGGHPVILTTADGLDWVPATVEHVGDTFDVQALGAGGPGYIAGGTYNSGSADAPYRAVAWTSIDGATWTRVPDSPDFDNAQIAWVLDLGDEVLAVGFTGSDPLESIVWVSPDGKAWSPVPVSLPAGIDQISDPVVASGRVWAAGWPPLPEAGGTSGSPVLLTSTDGRSWVQSDTPLIGSLHVVGSGLYTLVNTPSNIQALSLRRFEPSEAASSGVYRLTESGAWQPLSSGLDQVGLDLVDVDGTLVMVGQKGPFSIECGPGPTTGDCPVSSEPQAWRSTDRGRHWEPVAVSGGQGSMLAAAGLRDGTVVAVGSIWFTIAKYDAKAWLSQPVRPASTEATTSPAPSPSPAPVASPAPTPGQTAGQVLPTAVTVTCGAGAPLLNTNRVRASADGVRFVVSGGAGWQFTVQDVNGNDGTLLGSDLTGLTLRIPPGDVTVECTAPGPSTPSATPLRVEDPDGWYRSVSLDPVSGSCTTADALHGEGARGPAKDPVEFARSIVRDLQPGDTVERGGYPADTGLVRVVRSGHVIGVITFEADGQGGWLLSGASLCGGLSAG